MIGRAITQTTDPAIAAKSYTEGLRSDLVAKGGVLGGNIGLTVQSVMVSSSGNLQLGSAGNNNATVIYASGPDFVNGVEKTRLTLGIGEKHIETGLSAGAIIESSKGVLGYSDAASNAPITTAPAGFAGTKFIVNIFRNASAGNNIFVSAGAVPADVQVWSTDMLTPYGSASLGEFGYDVISSGTVNGEYLILATNPIYVACRGNASNDLRLVPPPADELITGNRNNTVSAFNSNTAVTWYRWNGTIGRVTVSPNAPIDLYTGTINEFGDIIILTSNATPATAGTFTFTINGETTAAIAYDAGITGLVTALDGLTTYSAADFEIEAILGDNLGQASSQILIMCKGLLARIAGTPSIDTTGLTGNVHTLTLYQSGTAAGNAGSDVGYREQGVLRLVGNDISCLCGADGSGAEATYGIPVKSLSQRIPLPVATTQTGTSQQSSICVVSPFRGDDKIFNSDGSLAYSFTHDRDTTITIDSKFKQRFPCAYNLSGTGSAVATGQVSANFTENFLGGYLDSNVGVGVIMNSTDNDLLISGGITTSFDETVHYGVTPDDIRAQIIADEDDGRKRRRKVSAGTETWELV